MIGDYHGRHGEDAGTNWVVPIDDQLDGESRPVVVRPGFPPNAVTQTLTVRARLHWLEEGRKRGSARQEGRRDHRDPLTP